MVGDFIKDYWRIGVLLSCLMQAACSDIRPGCGSDKVIDEVTTVLKNQAANIRDINIERVHTLRTNFATGEVLCSAAVVFTNDVAATSRTSVGYNVYYDTNWRLAVSVYGAAH